MHHLIKNKVYYNFFDKLSGLSLCFNDYSFNDDNYLNSSNQIKNYFDAKKVITMNQKHETNIIHVNNYNITEKEGDAIITELKDIVLIVKTADCVPILISNKQGNIISAIHASYKSVKKDIINKVSHEIKKKDQSKLYASIGPSIRQDSYEVGKEIYDEVIRDNNSYKNFFIEKLGYKYMFDLSGYVKSKLLLQGVHIIHQNTNDTYKNPGQYPSYRYACHNNIKFQGRILSAIVIKS